VNAAVAALILRVPVGDLVRCHEPLPHLYVCVVRDGEKQVLVRGMGDAQGRWKERGLPLLRRWLDRVKIHELGAQWTAQSATDLLEATSAWPPGFEHVPPDPQSGPEPRGGVSARPFSLWLVRSGAAVDPSAAAHAPEGPPLPSPVPGPSGAPGPRPVSRATLERDVEGGWRWRVETAWPAEPSTWQLVGRLAF